MPGSGCTTAGKLFSPTTNASSSLEGIQRGRSLTHGHWRFPVSDFQTFELHDLDERETVSFALAELPGHVEAFGFILGVQRRRSRDQDPANIEAAEFLRPEGVRSSRRAGHLGQSPG